MKDDALIGIDAGTSVLNSVASTCGGKQIAAAALLNPCENLHNGGLEQDMALSRRDAAATLGDLDNNVPDLAHRLVAIGVRKTGPGK